MCPWDGGWYWHMGWTMIGWAVTPALLILLVCALAKGRFSP